MADAPRCDRRLLLTAGGALLGATVLGTGRGAAAQGRPIVPRSSWGGDLPPTGPLEDEAPGDVRFLLVHHSASGNDYGPDEAVDQLRAFYAFHTGERGWPDVAYNFFVDRYGTVYEGRTGSLERPVRSDATGGSQGFAQLACLVGDFSTQPPTSEAQEALVDLLAGLAQRYGIDPSPDAQTTFVSRGSNRWPAGVEVTARTISGHRDMSQTSCPGDAGYALVTGELPARVAARAGRPPAAAQPPAPVAPPATAPPSAPVLPPGAPAVTASVTPAPVDPTVTPALPSPAVTVAPPTEVAALPPLPPPAAPADPRSPPLVLAKLPASGVAGLGSVLPALSGVALACAAAAAAVFLRLRASRPSTPAPRNPPPTRWPPPGA